MRWQDYIGKHRGETAYVCGLGDSWRLHLEGPKGTVIGVNDFERFTTPDYLVVVDGPNRFTPERWKYIEGTKARNVFSQLAIKVPNLIKINVKGTRGSTLNEPLLIDISYSSTFVAMNVAYWMGFSTIALCGADFNGHKLEKSLKEITKDLSDFADKASLTGCRVVSIVANSPNNGVLDYVAPCKLKSHTNE
jgi:hypothetical protein